MAPSDRARFIQAADIYLAVCEDDAAKQQAGQRLLDVLIDLRDHCHTKAYHYRECLFFAQPLEYPMPTVIQKWRLAVCPDGFVEQVEP